MTTSIIQKLLFGLTLAFSLFAHGETINGRVVGISDGDTLTILDASNTQFKIRLAAIDAPEKLNHLVSAGSRSYQTFVMAKMPASEL